MTQQSWLCQRVEAVETELQRVLFMLDRTGIRLGPGGNLHGTTWEVSEQQIAQWVAGTTLPLDDTSQYARFKNGVLEVRGGSIDVLSSATGPHLHITADRIVLNDGTSDTMVLDGSTGNLWATFGGFGGTEATPNIVLNSDGSVELVDMDVSGVLSLVNGGIIQSDNYALGTAGWRIGYEGNVEFNNAWVRGRISTAVFEYDEISASAGSIIVTPSAAALAEPYTAGGTMTVEGDDWLFTSLDRVRIRAKPVGGVVSETWAVVTRTATTNVYTTSVSSGDTTSTWPVGTAVLGYGQSGGTLLMTASLPGAPFYSVRTHSASPWSDEDEIVRLGNLNGSFGISNDYYGIGIGDYNESNYLLYDDNAGFRLITGSGAITLDRYGLTLVAPLVASGGGGVSSQNKILWESQVDDEQTLAMWAFTVDYGGGTISDFAYLSLLAQREEATFGISSQAQTAGHAYIQLTAAAGVVTTYLNLHVNGDGPAGAQMLGSFSGDLFTFNGDLQVNGLGKLTSSTSSDVPSAGAAVGALTVTNSNVNYGLQMGVKSSGSPWIQAQRTDGNATIYSLEIQPLGGATLFPSAQGVSITAGLGVGGNETVGGTLYVTGRTDVVGLLLTQSNLYYYGTLNALRNGGWTAGSIYVPITNRLTSASWSGNARSTTAKTLIDLSAVFGLPAGVKAVYLNISIRDSGSAGSNACWMIVSPTNTAGVGLIARASGMPNDWFYSTTLTVPCDANGDIYYQISASGALTTDVYMEIWGYYI